MNDQVQKSRSVALVDLGENISIDLTKLARKLNSLQRTWRFQVVSARPKIGNPDVASIWFYIDRLFSELATHKPAEEFDYVVGITHVRLENRDSSLGIPDRDYFSLNDRKRFAVVTEAMLQWNSPTKTLYQYFAFLIIGELLEILAGVNLYHQSKEICLYDDCADRNEFRPAIERGRICPESLKELQNAQVASAIVADVSSVLSWCRRNSVRRSFEMTVANPLAALIIGTAVGWFSSVYITRDWYKEVAAFTALCVVAIFLMNRYESRNRRDYGAK